MPQSPSAGLLAFLLALPSLALVVPPASEATAAADIGAEPGAVTADAFSSVPGEALEARLRRLSEAIRARTGPMKDESLLAAGGWWNGNNRGWVNRGWPNRVQGNTYRPPQVWANFRPSWSNFSNGPRFLNW
jgi:rSAM-associated Gly-rich repeat protein